VLARIDDEHRRLALVQSLLEIPRHVIDQGAVLVVGVEVVVRRRGHS
jgi:hypothetical protein